MKFRRCVDAFLLVRESRGESFSLVGFLGQKVLSGGLGRVTPAVGFGGERSLCGVQRGHSGTHKG